MNKRILDAAIMVLCVGILISSAFQFVSVPIAAESETIQSLLEKVGIEDGTISFSSLQAVNTLFDAESYLSFITEASSAMRRLLVFLLLPYVLAICIFILAVVPGKWKYIPVAVLSMVSVGEVLYGVLLKLPRELSDCLLGLIDGKAQSILEFFTGVDTENLIQGSVFHMLRAGFWCCIAGMVLIYALSLVGLLTKERE